MVFVIIINQLWSVSLVNSTNDHLRKNSHEPTNDHLRNFTLAQTVWSPCSWFLMSLNFYRTEVHYKHQLYLITWAQLAIYISNVRMPRQILENDALPWETHNMFIYSLGTSVNRCYKGVLISVECARLDVWGTAWILFPLKGYVCDDIAIPTYIDVLSCILTDIWVICVYTWCCV